MSGRTLVIGESLIDVVRHPDGSTQEHVGGSPANVAIGLARLGHDIAFTTLVGDDERGARIASHLANEGISLTEGSIGGGRTSVATSTVDATGAATYSFDLTWELTAIQRAHPGATTSYDPNVRPSLRVDPPEVRAKIEALIGLSDVVKASDE